MATKSRKDAKPEAAHDPNEHAKSNAAGWYGSIREMVDALRAAEGTRFSGTPRDEGAFEDARQRIEESVLTVEVRSDWYSLNADSDKAPAEYMILLTTGGPALRLVGSLDEYGQPVDARLEWQDWGTPWTPWYGDEGHGDLPDRDYLLDFARCFYFGEGGAR